MGDPFQSPSQPVAWAGSSTLVESCLAPVTSTWIMPSSLWDMEHKMARTTGSCATVGGAGGREGTFVSDATGRGRSLAEQTAHLNMEMRVQVIPSLAHIVVNVAFFHLRATPLA